MVLLPRKFSEAVYTASAGALAPHQRGAVTAPPDKECNIPMSTIAELVLQSDCVFTAAGEVPAGSFVHVRITGTQDGDLVGEIEE